MYVNVREKMKEWGVEAEKGEGIKEEEKQRNCIKMQFYNQKLNEKMEIM